MASSVTLGQALWTDGSTINGQMLRQLDIAASYFNGGTATALQVNSGVINSVGGLQVVQGSGMNITVYAGFAIIAASAGANQGGYKAGSMVSNTLTVATSDPTNPRIDLVVIYVDDTGDEATDSYIEMVQGTPAASPSAPSAPSNSLTLAQIRVPAGASSIVTADITDKRTYTNPSGGVIPWPNTTLADGGHDGLIAYDMANDRYFHNKSAGHAEQLRVLPWAPLYETINSSVTCSIGSMGTLKSVNITTDGLTDIKVTTHWPALYADIPNPSDGGWYSFNFAIYLDGSQLSGVHGLVAGGWVNADGSATVAQAGGSDIYTTSAASGDTPSAATHTVYWKCEVIRYGGSSGTPIIQCSAAENAYMRVEPVIL